MPPGPPPSDGSGLPRPAPPPPPPHQIGSDAASQFPPYGYPPGTYPPGSYPPPLGYSGQAPGQFPNQVPGAPYPGVQYGVSTDGKAVASLVLGILGYMCFGPLAHIPGVILGHLARRDIRESNGTLGGDGLALAGLILSYVGIVLTFVMFVPFVLLSASGS